MDEGTFLNPAPVWLLPSVVLASAAVGFGVSALVDRHAWKLRPPDCSEVTPQGGVVAGVPYLEQMRKGASPNDAVPMVIVFHSLGATPAGHINMFKNLGPARLIAPAGEYGTESVRRWFTTPVRLALEDPLKQVDAVAEWKRAASRVQRFVRDLVRCRPTVGKPILTGSSQGGEMTLLLASTAPELFSEGVAVSSYLLPPLWSSKTVPLSLLHGTGDDIVPYAWARQYAEQMQERGAPIEFASYPSQGHEISKTMGTAWARAVEAARERVVARASK